MQPTKPQSPDNQAPPTDWDRVASNQEFKDLMAAKVKFVVPATIFFIVFYFSLPVLVGWFPDLMKTQVIGVVNIAYLFALSQFFVAWAIALLYMRKAEKFDAMGKSILARLAVQKAGDKKETR